MREPVWGLLLTQVSDDVKDGEAKDRVQVLGTVYLGADDAIENDMEVQVQFRTTLPPLVSCNGVRLEIHDNYLGEIRHITMTADKALVLAYHLRRAAERALKEGEITFDEDYEFASADKPFGA